MGGLFRKKNSSTPTVSNQGNRVNSLQIQQSCYGSVIPVGYGTHRLAGNIIDYVDFTPIPHYTVQSSGGGGGGKGGGRGDQTVTDVSYTYTARFVIALCYGVIGSIGSVWKDKSSVNLADLGLSLFTGTTNQTAWGEMTTYHPERALNYRNIAYVAGTLDLGENPSTPNLNFEVFGKFKYSDTILDANPKDVIYDLLTNTVYGASFSASYIADLSNFSDYCVANNVFISPVYTDNGDAHTRIDDLAKIANSEFVWSQGLLKIVPYGDTALSENGVTWTPDLTPLYDLTDDDFIEQDSPVECVRSIQADVYNSIKLEFLNRANDYNVEIVEVKDQANIELYGERPYQAIQAHSICDATIAKKVAQTLLDRKISYRNVYRFKLPIRYILLDPMDLVTITDLDLGLDRELVRIISIKESAEDELEIEAEEMCVGSASPAQYAHQESTRTRLDYNELVDNINPAIILEPPFQLTDDVLQVWLGASGKSNMWGGCDIWVSEDNITYKRLGKIKNPIRQGVLAAPLASSLEGIDDTNTLSVDLTMSRSSLMSGTFDDVNNFNTLCYVDGEYLAYKDAQLTDVYEYDIDYLNRGAYYSAVIAHNAGSNFVRIDKDSFYKYTFRQEDIGKSLYLKFQGFNVFGGGLQDLATLNPYQYTLLGTALQSSPDDITDLTTYYKDGYTYLKFTPIQDIRTVLYEVRLGTTWDTSVIIGRFTNNEILASGDGTYHVKPFVQSFGVYSENAESVEIIGSRITKNVLVTHSENPSWSGAKTNCQTSSGNIVLTDLSQVGYYYIPESEIVDIGESNLCYISFNYSLEGDSIYGNFDAITSVDASTNIDGNFLEYVSNSRVQIQLAGDDGIFGDWKDVTQAQYFGRKFNFKFLLSTTSLDITPVLQSFQFTVDMPDLIQKDDNVLVTSSGISVTYAKEFQVKPSLSVTIVDKELHDNPKITNESTTGFDIIITNDFDAYAGNTTQRYINYVAVAY